MPVAARKSEQYFGIHSIKNALLFLRCFDKPFVRIFAIQRNGAIGSRNGLDGSGTIREQHGLEHGNPDCLLEAKGLAATQPDRNLRDVQNV